MYGSETKSEKKKENLKKSSHIEEGDISKRLGLTKSGKNVKQRETENDDQIKGQIKTDKREGDEMI